MEKLLFIIILILINAEVQEVNAQGTLSNNTTQKQVAVYLTETNINNSFKRVVESKIISTLNSSNLFKVLERNERFISAIDRDRQYAESGRVDDSQIADFGKEAGAQYVLIVDMSERLNELFIAMRLVNVESAEIIDSSEDIVNYPTVSLLIDKVRDLTSKIIRSVTERTEAERLRQDAAELDQLRQEGDLMDWALTDPQPSFPGGVEVMYQWLSQNFKYPPEVREQDIRSRVVVEFIIRRDGSISNVVIKYSDNSLLNNEVVRVVRSMPQWTPGYHNGVPVNAIHRIPIKFPSLYYSR